MYEEKLREAIGRLRLGTPMSDGPLCILPLRSTERVTARYVLLDQALSRGTLTITEVSDAGAVPYLQAVNKGPWPVLIFDGEELVGAKQNRITNTTILVGVGKTVLPVSCMESGRWSYHTRAFSSGSYAGHPALRRDKERQVREHMALCEREREAEADQGCRVNEPQHVRAQLFCSDQGAVWEEVARTARTLGSHSPTMAMADTYEAGKDDLEKILRSLEITPSDSSEDVVGALVFLDGEFVCLDLLRPAKRFRRLYPKLLRGYALEALLTRARGAIDFDPEASALRLLAQVMKSKVEQHAGADLGYDLRLEDEQVSGSGLLWEEELIQLSVFPKMVA